MKFCTNCGMELSDDATLCPNCCYAVPSVNDCLEAPTAPEAAEDTDKAFRGLAVLSLLFPLVGFILAAVNRKKAPKAAKCYLFTALVAWAVALFLSLLQKSM